MHKHVLFAALSVATLITVSACGGDDEAATTPCPEGTAVGATVGCLCGDASVGTSICQDNNTLSECVCGPGGSAGTGNAGSTAGTTAGNGTGVAGTTAGTGTSGTGADEDSGVVDNADAAVADGGTVTPTTPKQPVMDGTFLASCTSSDDCKGGRECYTASGATPVGYCTSVCTKDSDCTSLGDNFACSTASLTPGALRYCRVSCDGPTDKSCPQYMTCTEVPSGPTTAFRCLYDAKDIGDAKAKVFDQCEGTGDCAGDLVCYASNVLLNDIGGMSYSGYCTQTCSKDNDCTENPATGDVAPTCDNEGTCGLSCDSLLGLGAPDCPDDMECVANGLLTDKCLYVDRASGGI